MDFADGYVRSKWKGSLTNTRDDSIFANVCNIITKYKCDKRLLFSAMAIVALRLLSRVSARRG